MQGGKTLLYMVRTRRKKRYLVAVQTYKQSTYPAFAYRKVLRQELNSPHQRPVSFVSVAPTLDGPSSAKRLYLKGRLPTPRNPIKKYEKKKIPKRRPRATPRTLRHAPRSPREQSTKSKTSLKRKQNNDNPRLFFPFWGKKKGLARSLGGSTVSRTC